MPSNDKRYYKDYTPAQMEELRTIWREKSRIKTANWTDEQRKLHNKRTLERNKLNYKPHPRQYKNPSKQLRYNLVTFAKFEAGHCADCLMEVQDWNHVMFAWDHQKQYEKLFNLSKASMYSVQEIKDELLKCQLVCHNCHAMRTYVFGDHLQKEKPKKKVCQLQLEIFI